MRLVIWTELNHKSLGAHMLLQAVRSKHERFCSAGSKWGGRKKRQQDAKKENTQVAVLSLSAVPRTQTHASQRVAVANTSTQELCFWKELSLRNLLLPVTFPFPTFYKMKWCSVLVLFALLNFWELYLKQRLVWGYFPLSCIIAGDIKWKIINRKYVTKHKTLGSGRQIKKYPLYASWH